MSVLGVAGFLTGLAALFVAVRTAGRLDVFVGASAVEGVRAMRGAAMELDASIRQPREPSDPRDERDPRKPGDPRDERDPRDPGDPRDERDPAKPGDPPDRPEGQ